MPKSRNVKNVSLASYDDIFKTDKERDESTKQTITEITIKGLLPFKNHPFKLYEGERFSSMVESVKANGIITPIIVRPLDNGTYEILSGHNRVEAARASEIETVPALIRENLSDEEALLIVTETNLIQRGFESLAHSERAAALAVHHEAVKCQGKRTDLICEIERLLKSAESIGNAVHNQTISPVGKRLNNVVKLGEEYGLSKNSVARYLRVNKLIKELQERVDNEEIPIRAAVEISYLSNRFQAELNLLLQSSKEKVDIKKAALLREYSENNNLTKELINGILSGVTIKKKNRAPLPVQSLKIGGKILSKYFKPEQKPDEIQAELFTALEFYRTTKKD